MNCVTSSSPSKGLRTIHLLRSILFRALPWHAIPADSTLCLHHSFLTLKSGTSQVSHRALLRCHAVAACSAIAAEIPTGFHVACRTSRWRSLIYLLSYRWWNIMVWKKCLQPCSPASPWLLNNCKHGTFILFHYSFHFTAAPLGFFILTFSSSTPVVMNYIVVFSKQHTQHYVALALL